MSQRKKYRIQIEIKDKIATCLTELPVVCGNADYEVEFLFDEEWKEHDVKTATFVVNGGLETQVFRGNVCDMPVFQNTLVARVGVFAGTIDDGTLSTSTPAIVHCKPCATDGKAMPAPPKDDVYNQLIEKIERGMLKGDKGEKGEKGEAFTYEDFSDEQLAALKGEKGEKGEQGEKGEKGEKGERGADGTVSFDDLTEEQKASLVGKINLHNISAEKVEKVEKITLENVPLLDGMWMKNNSLYTANADFKRTDFIEVIPNKEYTLCVYYGNATVSSTVSNGKIFDADKNIIADFGDGENHIITITMPENAKYIQFSVTTNSTNTDLTNAYSLSISAMYYQYTVDTKVLEWLKLTKENIPDDLFTSELFGENSIKGKQISGRGDHIFGDNLLNGITYINDTYINTSYFGSENPNNFGVSYAEIKVEGGNDYAITVYDKELTQNICVFADENNNTIHEIKTQPYYTFLPSNIADNVFIVKAPESATKLQLNVLNTEKSTAIVKKATAIKKQLEWLELSTENISDDFISVVKDKVNENEIKYGDSLNKPFDFNNKKIVAFGDSITQGYISPNLQVKPESCYIKLFANKFGMTLENKGVGGSCITDQEDNQYTIYKRITTYTSNSNTDFIVISGGTNDYNTGKPLGDFNSTDVKTFYGALRGICEHLKTNHSNTTVIFITPIPVTKDFPYAILPLDSYRNAIYEIATLYGFNVVNGADLGFPTKAGDWANEIIENSDGCHPTEKGHALYFRNLCGKLL